MLNSIYTVTLLSEEFNRGPKSSAIISINCFSRYNYARKFVQNKLDAVLDSRMCDLNKAQFPALFHKDNIIEAWEFKDRDIPTNYYLVIEEKPLED